VADLVLLFSDLIRLETELWNAVDARLRAECGLPMSWFDTMQVIARRPGCRVQDIASDLAITVGGASKMVDRIEAAGYGRRRANPDDRRSSIVEVTPAGRRVQAKATKVLEDELAIRLGAALPQRSLEQFGATIRKLRAAGRSVGTNQEPA